MSNDIWKRHQQLQRDRSKKMQELMKQYDEEVYYPTLKQIQEDCLKEHGSHAKTTFHDNGLGWSWWYCGRCGVSHGKESDGQE